MKPEDAHEHQLERLVAELDDEFGEKRTREQIRACADTILSDYDDVSVTRFTEILAARRARQCLRAPVCEPLIDA